MKVGFTRTPHLVRPHHPIYTHPHSNLNNKTPPFLELPSPRTQSASRHAYTAPPLLSSRTPWSLSIDIYHHKTQEIVQRYTTASDAVHVHRTKYQRHFTRITRLASMASQAGTRCGVFGHQRPSLHCCGIAVGTCRTLLVSLHSLSPHQCTQMSTQALQRPSINRRAAQRGAGSNTAGAMRCHEGCSTMMGVEGVSVVVVVGGVMCDDAVARRNG